MSTANLSWAPGGGGGLQSVEYKQSTASTYTQYTTVGASTNSVSIPGIIDNILYNFRIVNNCSGGLPTQDLENGVYITCPTVTTVSTDTTIQVSFPNLGGNISSYIIELRDAGGTNILQSHTSTGPFPSTIVDDFTGLSASTSYNVRVKPGVGSSFIKNDCSLVPVSTESLASCGIPSAPTVILT